jgi:hypothetical protein
MFPVGPFNMKHLITRVRINTGQFLLELLKQSSFYLVLVVVELQLHHMAMEVVAVMQQVRTR